MDELNKYAPSGGKESPITQQVLDVAERGRSLGVILISAQQFMSAVHNRVTGNSATKIIGRTGSAKVNTADYVILEQDDSVFSGDWSEPVPARISAAGATE